MDNFIAFNSQKEALEFYLKCIINGIYVSYISEHGVNMVKVNVEKTLNRI